MARIVKRRETAVRRSKSTGVANKWKFREGAQLSKGIYLMSFENKDRNAKYLTKDIRIDSRAKKVVVAYGKRGGYKTSYQPKYSAGWLKMVRINRANMY